MSYLLLEEQDYNNQTNLLFIAYPKIHAELLKYLEAKKLQLQHTQN